MKRATQRFLVLVLTVVGANYLAQGYCWVWLMSGTFCTDTSVEGNTRAVHSLRGSAVHQGRA